MEDTNRLHYICTCPVREAHRYTICPVLDYESKEETQDGHVGKMGVIRAVFIDNVTIFDLNTLFVHRESDYYELYTYIIKCLRCELVPDQGCVKVITGFV